MTYDGQRVVALLNELGIRRTEITADMLAAVDRFSRSCPSKAEVWRDVAVAMRATDANEPRHVIEAADQIADAYQRRFGR